MCHENFGSASGFKEKVDMLDVDSQPILGYAPPRHFENPDPPPLRPLDI